MVGNDEIIANTFTQNFDTYRKHTHTCIHTNNARTHIHIQCIPRELNENTHTHASTHQNQKQTETKKITSKKQ